MLSLQTSSSSGKSQKCTPNLLPARINHNGPINDTERYFQPKKDEKGTSHAYLRGRHLHGTTVALPENCTGAVLRITEDVLPQSRARPEAEREEEGESDDEELQEEVKVAEALGEFDELVVWGHAENVDEEKDAFIRGMREWVGFANALHVEEEKDEKGER